jgi:integrase
MPLLHPDALRGILSLGMSTPYTTRERLVLDMAERPKVDELPVMSRGDGGWGFDEKRSKITLRHRWHGKQHIERGETPQECLIRRDRRRRDADVRATLSGDGTVGGLLAAWLEFQQEGRAAGTAVSYNWTIKRVRRLLGADVLVTELNIGDIETMYARAAREIPGSINKFRAHVNMALDFGVRRKLMPAAVREELRQAIVPPIQVRAPLGEQRWFDLADYVRVRGYLLAHREARNALFLTMLLCGLRPGEAMGLRWEYVDLDARVLRVEGTIGRVGTDKDRYTRVLKTDRPNNRCAHRQVPIPGDLKLVLDQLPRIDEFVFIEDIARTRGQRIGFRAVEHHAHEISMRLQVPRVSPNGYRHTFASVCRHHGMPYEQLAKLMGHRDATMIITTYGHPIVNTAPVDLDRYLGNPEC